MILVEEVDRRPSAESVPGRWINDNDIIVLIRSASAEPLISRYSSSFYIPSSISGVFVHGRVTYTDVPSLSLSTLLLAAPLSLSTLTRTWSLLRLVYPNNPQIFRIHREKKVLCIPTTFYLFVYLHKCIFTNEKTRRGKCRARIAISPYRKQQRNKYCSNAIIIIDRRVLIYLYANTTSERGVHRAFSTTIPSPTRNAAYELLIVNYTMRRRVIY